MTFKKNITITVACVITECLISLIPTILIIYIFFMTDKINEIFSTLLIIPYLILIINAFFIIISLIAQLFIKTKYYVDKEELVIRTKTKVKKINYNEIANMTYDFGNLIKFNTMPSQLILFGKDFKQLLSINNPSIIMVHLLKKKCKKIKMSYYHNKRFFYLFALINGISLIFSIFARIFL